MPRQFRFRIAGQPSPWTRWFTDSDDLAWLKDNTDVLAVEISEEMTSEEAQKRFPELFIAASSKPVDQWTPAERDHFASKATPIVRNK
jgi:hypothetical protein